MLHNAKDFEYDLAIDTIWLTDKSNKMCDYYCMGADGYISLENKDNVKEFVSVNSNNEIVGFIKYYIEDDIAYGVEICSIRDDNFIFGADIYKCISNAFSSNGINKIKFCVHKNNKHSVDTYARFVEKGKGNFVGENGDWLHYEINKCQWQK